MHRWTGKLVPAIGSIALLASAAMPVSAQNADPTSVDLQIRVDEFVGPLNGGVAAVTVRDGVTEAAAAGIANIDGELMTVGLGEPVYTGGIATVLPGGTLPLAGTIDMTGPQTSYRDGTATVVHTSTYTCDVAL